MAYKAPGESTLVSKAGQWSATAMVGHGNIMEDLGLTERE